jgi:hypothetical protein
LCSHRSGIEIDSDTPPSSLIPQQPPPTKTTAIMASENAKSLKVLDELMQQLTISKDAAAIKEASSALASFVNGRIEDKDCPTK